MPPLTLTDVGRMCVLRRADQLKLRHHRRNLDAPHLKSARAVAALCVLERGRPIRCADLAVMTGLGD